MSILLANRLFGGMLLIAWGLASLHFDKKRRNENSQELENEISQYMRNPYRTGFVDAMLAFFDSFSPRIVQLFYAPVLSWVVIVIGGVAVLDVLILVMTRS